MNKRSTIKQLTPLKIWRHIGIVLFSILVIISSVSATTVDNKIVPTNKVQTKPIQAKPIQAKPIQAKPIVKQRWNLQDVDINYLINQIAQMTQYNIIVDPKVRGKSFHGIGT